MDQAQPTKDNYASVQICISFYKRVMGEKRSLIASNYILYACLSCCCLLPTESTVSLVVKLSSAAAIFETFIIPPSD